MTEMMKTKGTKMIVLMLALVLLVGGAIGGTLAWLMTQTDPVINTFSVGNISMTLTETGADNTGNNSSFKIVPGTSQDKDPVVTIEGSSENCWVFVQVTEANNIARAESTDVTELKYVTWEIDDAVWTAVPGAPGVYYTTYELQTADKELNVLKGKTVSYSSELTKAMMDNIATMPTLTFKAFAIQSTNLTNQSTAVTTAEAAWAMIQAQNQ